MSPLRFVVFLLVVGGLSALLHRYVWIRFVRDLELPRPWPRVLLAVLVVLGVSPLVVFPAMRVLPRGVLAPLAFVTYGWMGLLFLLVVSLAVVDLGRCLIFAREMVRARAELDPTRRRAIGRIVAALAGTFAAGASARGVGSVLAAVDVRRHRVGLKRLPKELEGLTIAQLTDVHVGPTIGRGFIEDVVARTNALGADVIVITGDLVDGSVDQLREHVAPLGDLRAPLGVYFVTGNHEYYSGAEDWTAHLATLGIRVLRNERVELRRGEGVLDLVGVDDWSTRGRGGHDLARAVQGRDPAREAILLAHQPRSIVDAAAHGIGLQISGHTHGGQIMPFNFLVRLQQPYVAGLHRHEDTWIYVSSGTGYWGPPMRVGVPAEIAHLTLTRA
jgi:predicted MPP superfamily phosphohydrolase